jgi:hypothetical protein
VIDKKQNFPSHKTRHSGLHSVAGKGIWMLG